MFYFEWFGQTMSACFRHYLNHHHSSFNIWLHLFYYYFFSDTAVFAMWAKWCWNFLEKKNSKFHKPVFCFILMFLCCVNLLSVEQGQIYKKRQRENLPVLLSWSLLKIHFGNLTRKRCHLRLPPKQSIQSPANKSRAAFLLVYYTLWHNTK